MPRFMRPGDELQIGAVVINQTGATTEFAVDLSADLLLNSGSRSITLKAGQSQEVSFASRINLNKYVALLTEYREKPAARGPQQTLKPEIVLTGFVTARAKNTEALTAKGLKAADLTDRVKVEFPILESPAAEAFAITGYTENAANEAIVVPNASDVLGNLGAL